MNLKSAVAALKSAEYFLKKYAPRLTEKRLEKMSLSKLELYEDLTSSKWSEFDPVARYIENLLYDAIDLYDTIYLYTDGNISAGIPLVYDINALYELSSRFSDVNGRLCALAHSVFVACNNKFIDTYRP